MRELEEKMARLAMESDADETRPSNSESSSDSETEPAQRATSSNSKGRIAVEAPYDARKESSAGRLTPKGASQSSLHSSHRRPRPPRSTLTKYLMIILIFLCGGVMGQATELDQGFYSKTAAPVLSQKTTKWNNNPGETGALSAEINVPWYVPDKYATLLESKLFGAKSRCVELGNMPREGKGYPDFVSESVINEKGVFIF